MSKVIVLTSSMIEDDFLKYQDIAKKKSNPSNQNFYSKLIKALSIFNDVSVISHRPISTQMFDKTEFESKKSQSDNISYYYTYISNHISYKPLHEFKSIYHEATKCIDDLHTNDFVVIVDVLRYNLLKAARKIGRKYHVPVIGMLTDNPQNLSAVTKKYINKIFSYALSLDGYLSLTNGLLKVFNTKNKPFYVFEGLVETISETKKDPLGEYLFFSGSLYERYGVKTMIDAYCASNIKYKLIICGSGPLEEYITNKEAEDSRILYLSQLDKNKILSLQQHAVANINPRPLNDKLDQESIPSKLLEYFASGAPTLSTKHPLLYKIFKSDAVWFENGEFESFKNGFDAFMTYNSTSLKKMASSAKIKVYSLFDLRVQGESITHFIDSLRTSENK